jgi:hypothetical protein
MGRVEERAIKILRNVPKRLVANLRHGRLQRLSGKVATKFMDNDHNKPLRVESASIRPNIQGQNWDQFYNAGGKPFDQYYRHGGNWRYGTRIWKSQTMTSKNTKA